MNRVHYDAQLSTRRAREKPQLFGKRPSLETIVSGNHAADVETPIAVPYFHDRIGRGSSLLVKLTVPSPWPIVRISDWRELPDRCHVIEVIELMPLKRRILSHLSRSRWFEAGGSRLMAKLTLPCRKYLKHCQQNSPRSLQSRLGSRDLSNVFAVEL